MEPWLDSLSEDWDSQPRDSPSLPSKTPSLPSDDASFASHDRSQSRLPIVSTKNSLSSSKRNGFLRTRSLRKSVNGGDNTAPVLGEHSSSKLNVAAQQALNKPEAKSARRSSLPRPSSRAVSEISSSQSVQHHTLQHRSSRGSAVRDSGAGGGETP